jgi:hypothetical protein
MSSPQEIAVIEAERNYYRDSVALLRARLYRQGASTSPRLEEHERRFNSAQLRLRAARAKPAPAPAPQP